MAQTRIRPEQVRLDLDWNFTGHLSVGEDGIIAATRLLDIDGITTGFGAVLTPSMGIDSPLFYGLYTRLETEVAAITVTDAISLFVEDPIKGAGSTMTNLYGLCIEDLTQGTARNWAICIRGDDPIVWANDTNLYRGAANILKTDDSFQATRVFTGDGLVGSPAHSFISDVDIGMYRIGVNDLGFTTNSTLALELNAVQQALVTNGTDGAPGLGFISDPDTGLYRVGANRLGFTTGGAGAWEIDATQHLIPAAADTHNIGSAAAEILNFYMGDAGKIIFGLAQDVNLYRSAAAVLKTDHSLTVVGNLVTQASLTVSSNVLGIGGGGMVVSNAVALAYRSAAHYFQDFAAANTWLVLTATVYPGMGHKVQDFGIPITNAWDDGYADDWHNVADFYFMDERKDREGKIIPVDDLAIICGMMPTGEFDPRTGLPLLDDDSIPPWVFTKDKEGKETLYDEDSKPYLSMKMVNSLTWGALRQVEARLEALEAK